MHDTEMTTESVEQVTVRARIDQCAIIVLAMNLYQRAADIAHQCNGRRLIIDEDACTAVRRLQTTQNDVAVIVNGILSQDFACRVIAWNVENSRHLALCRAMAHQRGIATCTQRQRQRVQQDGFAGAGFTGQNGKARREINVEPFDQDDIANR